jgi:hypothetical protein
MNTALRLATAALLTGTIAACGSDDTGDDADAAVIEVTYDGTECTSNAPASVPAGEQTFVLINNSDHVTQLLVADIEEGHTYQELIDLQNEAGGAGTEFGTFEWLALTPLIAPASKISDTEMQYEYDLQIGGISLFLAPSGQLWLCGGFEAVDG